MESISHQSHTSITGSVLLKETDQFGDENKIEIGGLNSSSLAFRLDNEEFPQLSQLLRVETENINKKCDFVLFTEYKGRKCIILIEMKSSREGDYETQLKNGELFLKYIISLIDFNNEGAAPNLQYIPVLIAKSRRTLKRPTDRPYKAEKGKRIYDKIMVGNYNIKKINISKIIDNFF